MSKTKNQLIHEFVLHKRKDVLFQKGAYPYLSLLEEVKNYGKTIDASEVTCELQLNNHITNIPKTASKPPDWNIFYIINIDDIKVLRLYNKNDDPDPLLYTKNQKPIKKLRGILSFNVLRKKIVDYSCTIANDQGYSVQRDYIDDSNFFADLLLFMDETKSGFMFIFTDKKEIIPITKNIIEAKKIYPKCKIFVVIPHTTDKDFLTSVNKLKPDKIWEYLIEIEFKSKDI